MKHNYLWPIFFICHLGLALLLSWHSLAKIDFAYPVAYEAFDINEHILHYAPENRHRSDFEYTTAEQHKQFFAAISHAINHQGEGLESLEYQDKQGKATTLLHRDEILHLLDVAKLIDYCNLLGLILLVIELLIITFIAVKKYQLPNLKSISIGHLAGLIILGGTVLLIGPKKVFYTLHVWVFPPDHPWFFYYQDSLMTTLMKAPDIFAFIAILLISLACVIWGITLLGFKWFLNNKTKNCKTT